MNDSKDHLKAPLIEDKDKDEVRLSITADKPNEKPAESKPAEEQYAPVSFFKLYRFANGSEKFLIFIGIILSIISGAAFPLFSLIWGNTANAFSPDNIIDGKLKKIIGGYALQMGGIGVAVLLLFMSIISLLKYVGQKQGTRLRSAYLRALTRQEMGFFDLRDPAAMSSRVEEDCKTILEATEDKLLIFISTIFTFIGGFIVAFYRGWQLTLVLLCLTPFQAIAGALYGRFVVKAVDRNSEAYAKAGAIAEQALSAIRTVVGLSGEDKESARYSTELAKTKSTMMRFGLIQGLSIGCFGMVSYFFYATAFYFGSTFIQDGVKKADGNPYTGGDVLSVYFAVISGASSLVMTAPSMKAFAAAKQTAARVFSIIDRPSLISHEDPKGVVPQSLEAKIEFKDVVFSYPSNPDKVVLKGINMEIPSGKSTAIVGESGSGKSTIVQLIERLYDPNSGSVSLDGADIRGINLKWLRQNISYVGQEPVLFTGTIRENLALAKDNVEEAEMVDALKKANAYDFVMKLEKKMDTYVGVGGIQLSGGQKQRIAIARAILRNTKILLLDEATSALDRKNEKTIQETLDRISVGLTTIIIAHRLSTVKNADNIIVINNGQIAESGTHSELVNKQGLYYKLQANQLGTDEINDANNKEDESPTIETTKVEEEEVNAPVLAKAASNKVAVGQSRGPSVVVQEQPEAPKVSTGQALTRLFTFSKPERPLFVCSLLVSMAMGAVAPSIAILISDVLFVLLDPTKPDFKPEANRYSLYFLILAFVVFFLYAMQFWFFAILAESLTNRIRTMVFKKYLHMNMAWHDRTENASGILTSALATDASNVSSLTSTVIGLMFQAVSAMITGITIGFVFCWQIACVSMAMVPIFLILGGCQKSVTAKIREQQDAIKQSGQIVSEVVNNIRTVACLGQEDTFRAKYEKILKTSEARMIRLGAMQGFFMGTNQLLVFVYFAVTFYVGALVTTDKGLDPRHVFIGLFAIIYAIFNVSGSLRYLPDVTKANDSANLLFKHIDMKSEIDIDDSRDKPVVPIRGDIEFRNVTFKYPTRDNDVFKGLSFNVPAGNKVALVGSSGCGKSTIVQLLLRFYDVKEGEILIDGKNIKDFNLRHLRKTFGFVSQEPVLFNGSIEYNIKYSKSDATDEEMKQAANLANALQFIQNNEFDVMNQANIKEQAAGSGFQRLVGPKGTQLSGGQKQRIAIARAIINKPTMLLLDEATSALDSQNEAIVQDSLDKVTEGVTTLTVAHRFSTIKNSDEILVFKEGEIVERGRYNELNEMKGYFYQLERGLD